MPDKGVFHVNDVGDAPEVMQGSLEEMTRWAGAKSVEVGFSFDQLDGMTATAGGHAVSSRT